MNVSRGGAYFSASRKCCSGVTKWRVYEKLGLQTESIIADVASEQLGTAVGTTAKVSAGMSFHQSRQPVISLRRAVLHPARHHRIADLLRRRQHRHRHRGRPILLQPPASRNSVATAPPKAGKFQGSRRTAESWADSQNGALTASPTEIWCTHGYESLP
jgi:hypothetical protein